VPGVKPRIELLQWILAAEVSTAAICAIGRGGTVSVGRCEGADTGEPHDPQKRCVSEISPWQDGQRMCGVLTNCPVSRPLVGTPRSMSGRYIILRLDPSKGYMRNSHSVAVGFRMDGATRSARTDSDSAYLWRRAAAAHPGLGTAQSDRVPNGVAEAEIVAGIFGMSVRLRPRATATPSEDRRAPRFGRAPGTVQSSSSCRRRQNGACGHRRSME
jgi:hypothetical protein